MLFLVLASAIGCAPSSVDFSPEQLAQAAQLRDQALAGSGAYGLVAELTTEVGQRLAGSAGDERGRQWAEAKFRELGYDKVWTEEVRFPLWERGSEAAALTEPQQQPLVVSALGGSVGTPAGGLNGEVVLYPSLAELLAAAPGSAAGKIAFINHRTERARDGRGYGAAVVGRVQGASAAARAGAIAVLVRSIGTDQGSSSAHTGTMRYDNTPTRIPAAAVANADADLLEQLLGGAEPVRVALQLGARVRSGEYRSANVIGEITGSVRPQERVLLGAHLDSWDLGTGAVDDGTGIAITMATGALIGKSSPRPRRSIRVVAYANEEQGVYGGKAYAALHKDDMAAHVLATESDLGSGRVWRFETRFAPNALRNAEQMMELLRPLGIERGGNEANGGADVGPLREAGVAVVGLNQDATDYFDVHHTENDTLDRVVAVDLDQNVAATVVVAWLAADHVGYFDGRAPDSD